MKFTELDLEDYGIFRNEKIDDLSEGIILIAGPQRAGKTTLMEAIRRIPFGITSGEVIPSNTDRHRIKADVVNGSRDLEIELDGQKNPKAVSLGDGEVVDLEDLKGDISRKQYEHIFTISLDQLKRLPEEIDEEDFSQILLGAAYGDVAEIPKIKDEFDDKAYSIGRSYGKPTGKSELKESYDKITEGIEARKEANKQVNEYRELAQKKEDLVNKIEDADKEIEKFKKRTRRLRTVENSFEQLDKYREFSGKLESSDIDPEDINLSEIDEAKSLQTRYKEVTGVSESEQKFQNLVEADNNEKYRQKLIENSKKLEKLKDSISGWKQSLKHVKQEEKSISKKESKINSRIKDLRTDWSPDFKEILDIETNELDRQNVNKAVERYKKHLKELKDSKKSFDNRKKRLEELENKASSIKDRADKRLPVIALAGGAPIGVWFVAIQLGEPGLGPIAGLITALTVLGAYYLAFDDSSETSSDLASLNTTIDEVSSDVSVKRDDLSNAAENYIESSREISDLRSTLEIPEDAETDYLKVFYQEIIEIQSEIRELQSKEKKIQDERKELKEEIEEAAETVSKFKEIENEELEEKIEEISNKLEKLHKQLEVAKKLEEEENKCKAVKKEIAKLLDIEIEDLSESEIKSKLQNSINKAELDQLEKKLQNKFKESAITEAFKETGNADIEAMLKTKGRYPSQDELEEEIEETKNDISEIEEEMPERKKEGELDEKLRKLASDDDIQEAQEQIIEAREDFRDLGEEYVINRYAEKIAEKLNKEFINQIAGSLMEEASKIFSDVTQEYERIEHNQKLDDLNFKATRNDGEKQSITELSRATREQLFMALRVARIRQIENEEKVNLPVVIDDSMTNFDPEHTSRMLQIIDKLSETNQVFILTCHPELIEIAEEKSNIDQYLGLKKGSFQKCNNEKQIEEILTN